MMQTKSKPSLLKGALVITGILLKLFLVLVVAGGGMMILFDWVNIPEPAGAIVASQVSMLVFGLSMYDFKKARIVEELKKRITKEIIFKALSATMFVLLLNVILGLLIKTSGEVSDTVDTFVNDMSLLSAILLPVFIAPLFEELAFRGGLKYALVDKNNFSKIGYIIISSIIFGSLHYQQGPLALTHVLLTGGMGAIYAIFYLKNENIYISMISHLMYNGLVMGIALGIN